MLVEAEVPLIQASMDTQSTTDLDRIRRCDIQRRNMPTRLTATQHATGLEPKARVYEPQRRDKTIKTSITLIQIECNETVPTWRPFDSAQLQLIRSVLFTPELAVYRMD